ncbi:MAG: hypothetical protein RMJ56_07655 [Gemmataceae bacterium]|nr:hypothetical protein [Gemmata sp.]MDW8197466.1 hypothetical protein [Gemmataceae bacterium]
MRHVRAEDRGSTENAPPGEAFPDYVPARGLTAYLLGRLDFETLNALQRRLIYEVSGDRDRGAVIVCDHPVGITIGREGSAAHVRPSAEQLALRGWPVRWVARGGGTMLHLPGQVTCYPIVALDALRLTAGRFVQELLALAVDLLGEFGLTGTPDYERPGVRVAGRRLVHVGVAIRRGVTGFGLIVNVDPDLAPFWDVRCDGDPMPMTSLARESPHRVRRTTVRQRLVELLAHRFGFDRLSVFHNDPAPLSQSRHHALPHGS